MLLDTGLRFRLQLATPLWHLPNIRSPHHSTLSSPYSPLQVLIPPPPTTTTTTTTTHTPKTVPNFQTPATLKPPHIALRQPNVDPTSAESTVQSGFTHSLKTLKLKYTWFALSESQVSQVWAPLAAHRKPLGDKDRLPNVLLWNIAIQPAFVCSDLGANIHSLGCSPLGENNC